MCIRFGPSLTESTKFSLLKMLQKLLMLIFVRCVWSRAQDSLDLEINQNVFVYSLELCHVRKQCSIQLSNGVITVKLAAGNLLHTPYFSQFCVRLLPQLCQPMQ